MSGTVVGADQAEVDRAAGRARGLGRDAPDPETGFVGTVEQVAARIREYEAVGVSRVYLQHLLHRDLEAVELIGRELVGAVA